MNPPSFARLAPIALALVVLPACGDDDGVLVDRDGAIPADAGAVDGGQTHDAGRDAGPPDAGQDSGPPCETREPSVPSDPADGAWADGFGNPGVGGGSAYVSAFAFGGGVVYAGGSFTSAGYTAVSNVAAWDAVGGWRALGAGLPTPVTALAVGEAGALYAVHAAELSGPAARISRWDGAAWSTFAESDGPIFEIETLGGALYAVGDFTSIGGAAHVRVAYHDGTSWRGYAGLEPDALVATISAVAPDDVCIGGAFSTLDVVAARGVACWDGTAWQARSLPDLGGLAVHDLQRDPADGSLVAGGSFRLDELLDTGGGVARWTGSEWALVGGGVMRFGPGESGNVVGLAFTGSGLYVGGAFGFVNASLTSPTPADNVARWDGTEWRNMGGLYREGGFGFGGPVGAVAAGPDGSVYFGGTLTRADRIGVGRVVRWDGTYWQGLRTPSERYDGVSGQVLSLARRGTCEVYVGGDFRYAGDARADGVARYVPGEGYEPLGDGLFGGVSALAVTPSGRLYAGGDFVDESGAEIRNVAMWDGLEWSALGLGVAQPVAAITVHEAGSGSADVVYVGGELSEAGGARVTNLARWDGSAWSDLGRGMRGFPYDFDPSQLAPSRVSALLIDPETGDLIAGGTFAAVGADDAEVETNNIARWDGTRWHAYGDGLGDAFGPVLALAWWDGRLVAAGEFTSSGRDEVLRFAVWTGSDWEPIGTGAPGGTPSALDVVGDVIFTAGNLDFDAEKRFVAVFDGTTWSPLGQGTSDAAQAVLGIEGGVLAGGVFDRAGGEGAAGIALWSYAE